MLPLAPAQRTSPRHRAPRTPDRAKPCLWATGDRLRSAAQGRAEVHEASKLLHLMLHGPGTVVDIFDSDGKAVAYWLAPDREQAIAVSALTSIAGCGTAMRYAETDGAIEIFDPMTRCATACEDSPESLPEAPTGRDVAKRDSGREATAD